MAHIGVGTWSHAFSALLLLVCMFVAAHGAAAPPLSTYYIRPAGTKYGTGSGADWANAFSGFQQSYVRGCTYYVSAGMFTENDIPRFGDADTNGLMISFLHATQANHGTDVGWTPSLGDSPTVWYWNGPESGWTGMISIGRG